jgi:hypothetical protein
MIRMPGGVGMRSARRTRPRPPTVTPLLATGPIGSGYGTPVTELIIKQIDPVVANGIPPAVISGGKMPRMVPVSGGPAAPGVIITEQPMLTGGPGIFSGFSGCGRESCLVSKKLRRKRSYPFDAHHRSLERR